MAFSAKNDTLVYTDEAGNTRSAGVVKAVISDATGAALDPDLPTLVEEADSLDVAGSVTSAADLFVVDTTGYESLSLQITSAGTSCTVTFEGSEDNNNFLSLHGILVSSGAPSGLSSSATSAGRYKFDSLPKWVKVRVSTYGSGTVSVAGHLRKAPSPVVLVALSKPAKTDSSSMSPTNARIQSAATTNATSVKTSAGVVNHICVANNGAALAYLKLYNKASAPTVGTDTPLMTIALPANGLPVCPSLPAGIGFSTGIAYALTTGVADSDTGAVALNQVTGTIGYA